MPNVWPVLRHYLNFEPCHLPYLFKPFTYEVLNVAAVQSALLQKVKYFLKLTTRDLQELISVQVVNAGFPQPSAAQFLLILTPWSPKTPTVSTIRATHCSVSFSQPIPALLYLPISAVIYLHPQPQI